MSEMEIPPETQPEPQPEPQPQPQPQEQTQPAVEQQPQEETPQVIEIRPPPPFDSGLDEIIDEYAKLRGLDDRRTAAIKLAKSMYRLGANPDAYIKNVETYINNMSSLLSAIPDTEETIPVKGALLGKTAVEASKLIHKAHFQDYDEDLERDIKAVRRMAFMMRMLDKAFGGGNETSNKEIEALRKEVQELKEKEKLNILLQQYINPIQQQINQLNEAIKNITSNQSKPSDSLLTEIKSLNEKIATLETRFGLTKEISEIKSQLASLQNRPLNTTPTTPPQPVDPAEQITNMLDRTTKLLNSLREYAKTYGKEAGELDWKSVAISTIGEISQEAIKAYKEVASSKPSSQPTGQQPPQQTIDPIIERRVFNYAMRKIQEGATTINTVEAAKELGLTPAQVWDALTVIKNKGLLSARAVSQYAKKKEEKQKTEAIEEGEIIPGVEES